MREIWHGDCLEQMDLFIADNSIDLILCDLPYGTTACKWDTIIPFKPLWEQYERIIKPNGAIVLTSSQPFTTALISSKIELYKYGWIWEKSRTAGFFHAKNMPLKFHEDICVFSKSSIGHKSQLGDNRMVYNPQGLVKVDKIWHRPKKYTSEHNLSRPSHNLNRVVNFENHPKSVLKFSNGDVSKNTHPTEKPVPLFEYLIKTYSNESDLVLDNCSGSGTTAIACLNTNRRFICIEKDEKYFTQSVERVKNHPVITTNQSLP